MSPEQLHGYLKLSLRAFGSQRESDGLRALVETGSAETFLTGLLFIQLHSAGHKVSRELPLGGRHAADIVVHEDEELYIESKQLHLKDGCRFAPPNLVNDLSRHGSASALGVMYVADERFSTAEYRYYRFGAANRRATHGLTDVLNELPRFFRTVFPRSGEDALLREFTGMGRVYLYGFILAL